MCREVHPNHSLDRGTYELQVRTSRAQVKITESEGCTNAVAGHEAESDACV